MIGYTVYDIATATKVPKLGSLKFLASDFLVFLTYRSLAVCNFQGRGSRELQGRASAVPSRRAGWFTPKMWPLTREVGWNFLGVFKHLSLRKTYLKSDPAERKFKGWLKGCLSSTIFKRQCLWKSNPVSCTEQSVLRRSKLCTSWPLLPNMERAQQAMHHSWLGLLGFLFVNGELHVFCLFQQRWYSNYIKYKPFLILSCSIVFKLVSLSPW